MKKGKNKRKRFLMMEESSKGMSKLKKDAWNLYYKYKKKKK